MRPYRRGYVSRYGAKKNSHIIQQEILLTVIELHVCMYVCMCTCVCVVISLKFNLVLDILVVISQDRVDNSVLWIPGSPTEYDCICYTMTLDSDVFQNILVRNNWGVDRCPKCRLDVLFCSSIRNACFLEHGNMEWHSEELHFSLYIH
jgi:hypothetical protein